MRVRSVICTAFKKGAIPPHLHFLYCIPEDGLQTHRLHLKASVGLL